MSDLWDPPAEEAGESTATAEERQPPQGRSWLWIGLAAGAAVVLVTAALAVPYAVDAYRDLTRPTLDAVKIYEVRSDHTEKEVEYDPSPPPGGPHDPAWLDCGVYDEPVRDENAVHSLEHGTVWLTWDPDELDADDVSALAEQLPDKGILSPYPGQSAPVVATVWGAQLELDGADDDRLGLFLQEYGDGHTAPEPMASCAGGVRELDGDSGDSDGGPGVNV